MPVEEAKHDLRDIVEFKFNV
jgi:hypothetical protein